MTSARVLGNPMLMSDMRRMLRAYGENGPQHSTSSTPETSDLARVRRDLFGPVDHDDTQRFVDDELIAQQTRDADRWGFDFGRESPRKSGPGTARYSWEKVASTEPVPEPYALRRLPYLQQAAATVADDDEKVLPVEEKRKTEDDAAKVTGKNKQSNITDYMKGRKRAFSTTTSAKPQTPTPAPPPPKQARTTPS